MKVSKLLSNFGLICAAMLTQVAFAECNTVGMMGGCVPAAGMVDVPTHMKSQITNRVIPQKTSKPVAQTNTTSASKKSGNTNIAIASSTQTALK